MTHADATYLSLVREVLNEGTPRTDRTGTGTVSVFGTQRRYDLREGFPLLTTKRVYPRGVFGELVWFLNGDTNVKWLQDRNIRIWDEWADENGELGPVYGRQWRAWNTGEGQPPVDQVVRALRLLSSDPFSRRNIVSAWNVADVDGMALPPCHTMFQFYVTPDERGNPHGLSTHLYQRSGDVFLGVPFNIASYAALTHLFADIAGLVPTSFVHTIGDAHLYSNHLDQVHEQLSRADDAPPMPTLSLRHPRSLDEFRARLAECDDRNPDLSLFAEYGPESFVLDGYNPLPGISAPVAV